MQMLGQKDSLATNWNEMGFVEVLKWIKKITMNNIQIKL